MDSDRPIKSPSDDRLGFSAIAEHLTSVIMGKNLNDGLVIGIEGKWGSGKSSLLALTIVELKKQKKTGIIEFSPWLIKNKDRLLERLFGDLAKAVAQIDTDNSAQTKNKENKKLAQNLRNYAILAGGIGKGIGIAGHIIPGVGVLEKPMEHIKSLFETHEGLIKIPTLEEQREEIKNQLKKFSGRLVVVIDDLDRLEPKEAAEVTRLIRAVADFPKVIYVLSYDPDIVGHSLEKGMKVRDGRAYLEKIVQVNFRVPRPEAFDLRNWFLEEVNKLFPSELLETIEMKNPVRERLVRVVSSQGGHHLKTPRDISRTLNALRLSAIPVRDKIDISDMVWLQLVRANNPALYGWLEEYIIEVTAVDNGAHIPEEEKEKMNECLCEILENTDVDSTISNILHTINGASFMPYSGEEKSRIFPQRGEQMMKKLVAEKRLGSPQHYRYYFAFCEPVGALEDQQVGEFITLVANDFDEAILKFGELSKQSRPQGGTMAEVMIDRLLVLADEVSEDIIPNIIRLLAATMDLVDLTPRGGLWGQRAVWSNAERLLTLLFKRIDGEVHDGCRNDIFKNGPALGWLTSIFRSEIFAHGHYGDQKRSEDEWLLNADEFKSVLEVMLDRYRNTPDAELLKVPNLGSLLFAWMQGHGNDDEAKNWVEKQIKKDDDLLDLLSKLRSWRSSSDDGIQHPLNKSDLEHFFDYDETVERVTKIEKSSKHSEAERRLAKELLIAFEQGTDRF